jgi:GTP-binding protein YchF
MALGIGIVGLPNVGKSTTFNALTKAQNAQAANYPFCTIEPNKAIVTVPDARLDRIAAIVKPKQLTYATIEFVDIAGLVAGASRGEGLGNQFLGNIRETSAIVHVVRCFDDENVVHVAGGPDPARDMGIINTELILADMQSLEKRMDRLTKQSKSDKAARPMLEMAQRLHTHLGAGNPAMNFPEKDSDAFIETDKELRLITNKPVIYAANVDESGLTEGNPYVDAVKAMAEEQDAEVVVLCAKMEEEMAGMSDAERQEFLESLGASESGLDQVIRKGYHALGLISYFTAGEKEVRAWNVLMGSTAPQAAGVIHTDFERGFIRAEVIAFDKYMEHNGEAGAKAAGVMRVEGKDYIVQDADAMYFRFNV